MAAAKSFSPSLIVIGFLAFFNVISALFNGQPYTGSQSQIQELQQIASASRAQIANALIAQPASDVTASVNKHQNTSETTIAAARAIVASAIAQQRIVNKARVQNPLRNSYTSRHSSSTKRRAVNVQPLTLPNDAVTAAAALVAEVDAAAKFKNG